MHHQHFFLTSPASGCRSLGHLHAPLNELPNEVDKASVKLQHRMKGHPSWTSSVCPPLSFCAECLSFERLFVVVKLTPADTCLISTEQKHE